MEMEVEEKKERTSPTRLMDLGSNNLKLSKKQRRVVQKQLKLRHTLSRHENIECCDTASCALVVANGGLSNGVECEQLWNLFSKYGKITDIVMKPGKPYAFIEFSSVDEAVLAVQELNGKLLSHASDQHLEPNPRLYMLFTEECPKETAVSYAGSNFLPPGLTVVNDFITADEEQQLLTILDWSNAETASLKHRSVMHYGYRFDYSTNAVDRNPLPHGIPIECMNLMQRLLQQGLVSELPDQMTVNNYQPGQGIPPHVDTHSSFSDTIVIMNLQSQIVMEFRKCDGSNSLHVGVLLPQFSVAVLSGDARYEWTHGITPRLSDVVRQSDTSSSSSLPTTLTLMKRGIRTSLTFRTIRQSAVCRCKYVSQCDSQRDSCADDVTTCQQHLLPDNCNSDEQTLAANDCVNPSQLEAEHVHRVYETIASHFSSTRHNPWPRVVEFINQIPSGSIVADVGCGNGKYLGINPSIYMVGCDRSSNLCSICQSRGRESLVSDCLSVPFRTAAFDAVLCIAVIHHLSTEVRRLKALNEISRLLRVGGQALIYVWAVEQEKDNIKSKYLRPSKTSVSSDYQPEMTTGSGNVPSLPVHVNGTMFKAQDMFVPWHLKRKTETKEPEESTVQVDGSCTAASSASQVLHRYYHTFIAGELPRLCEQVAGVSVVNSYYDQGNWCVVIERMADTVTES